MSIRVVVLAGGELTSDDPLFSLLPEEAPASKAFLLFGGKPMLQWVLDALDSSEWVSGIIVVGQDEDAGFGCEKPVSYIPDQGGLIDNALAGIHESIRLDPSSSHTLLASADIPLLSTEMVDWVVENGLRNGGDILYHVIRQEVMEARFPGADRTYLSLRGMKVCGGDLNLISHRVVDQNNQIIKELAARRKNPIRQAALLGWDILLGLGLRILTLERGVEMISKRLNLAGKAVDCPFAELGMDVDKLSHYQLVKAEFEENQSKE